MLPSPSGLAYSSPKIASSWGTGVHTLPSAEVQTAASKSIRGNAASARRWPFLSKEEPPRCLRRDLRIVASPARRHRPRRSAKNRTRRTTCPGHRDHSLWSDPRFGFAPSSDRPGRPSPRPPRRRHRRRGPHRRRLGPRRSSEPGRHDPPSTEDALVMGDPGRVIPDHGLLVTGEQQHGGDGGGWGEGEGDSGQQPATAASRGRRPRLVRQTQGRACVREQRRAGLVALSGILRKRTGDHGIDHLPPALPPAQSASAAAPPDAPTRPPTCSAPPKTAPLLSSTGTAHTRASTHPSVWGTDRPRSAPAPDTQSSPEAGFRRRQARARRPAASSTRNRSRSMLLCTPRRRARSRASHPGARARVHAPHQGPRRLDRGSQATRLSGTGSPAFNTRPKSVPRT